MKFNDAVDLYNFRAFFKFKAPKKLNLEYWKVMKAIKGDKTEIIYLILSYTMCYSDIYFIFKCTKNAMNKEMKNIQVKI